MNNAQTSEAGFTLAELLVSLALLSVMTLYVLNSFSLMRQMKNIGRQEERRVEIQAVMQQFELEVSSLTPIFVADGTFAPSLYFDGRQDAITYAITADGTRETGGHYRVKWMLDQNRQLIVERKMLHSTAEEDARQLVVLQDVTKLEFSYHNNQPVWAGQLSLPGNIVLKVQTSENGLIERNVIVPAAQ